MKTNYQNQKWGLAFVRKSPLPPKLTWTEVPFYTYLTEMDDTKYYRAMQVDCPIDIEAIKSYPVYDIKILSILIEQDETVFIDWKGDYFIDKENCRNLSDDRLIFLSECKEYQTLNG
jgi:hypothetical protein